MAASAREDRHAAEGGRHGLLQGVAQAFGVGVGGLNEHFVVDEKPQLGGGVVGGEGVDGG
ncbi:hypothetical protein [Sphaerisporangium rubeum]|uniref:Uncharacterized protein n=1 Tax=Sphaerisporangium rubeum TaxID=321317 RepID=A0A7X0M9Q5_9ACTN|nr:hypothetical protein [Sphaerisporangium rubeum]MBB6476885.1 hypothetical protein [Sphaerisporangium rubeum]